MYHVGPHEFTATDAKRTLASLGELWRQHLHGLPFVPPEAVTTAEEIASRLERSTRTIADPETRGDPAAWLDATGAAAAECIADGTWDHDTTVAELAAAWSGVSKIGDALRSANIFESGPRGTLAQINVSDGGVPKFPVASADVGWRGVIGDSQAARIHHGRPWQALSLWSSEVIAGFAALGHSLHPGAAGENLTLTGVDWALVRPGVRLDIGDARCEISSFAIPCAKNARWFIDGHCYLMHHDQGPVSRVYATVLEPGSVTVGDDVVLQP